jgi:stage II sporulation protein GA (sporulation sigma-E factor processing peptidase)
MQIYLEYVLIDNLVINGFILLLTKELLKLQVKKINIFLASLVGAVFALFVPLVVLPPILLLIAKICVGLCIVSILKKYKNSLEFITSFLTFLTLTFVMGGVCFAILNLLNAQVTNSGVLIYQNEIPLGIILLVIMGYSYLMLNLIKNFYKKKSLNMNCTLESRHNKKRDLL